MPESTADTSNSGEVDIEKGADRTDDCNDIEKDQVQEEANDSDPGTDGEDTAVYSGSANDVPESAPDEHHESQSRVSSSLFLVDSGIPCAIPESGVCDFEPNENGCRPPLTRKGRRKSTHSSSLELRKLPVDLLLKPSSIHETGSVLSNDDWVDMGGKARGGKKDWLRVLCLRPEFSLKTQLMLTFGSINAITTIFVVLICIIVAITAGNNVKDINQQSFEELIEFSMGTTARYLADSLDARLMLEYSVNVLHEATLDRFAGYPSDSDDQVPFLDMDSGTRKYPIIGDFLSPDWDFETNVNEDNYEEYLQRRWKYYQKREVSTVGASFHMQGTCDPSADPSAPTYWPNCNAGLAPRGSLSWVCRECDETGLKSSFFRTCLAHN